MGSGASLQGKDGLVLPRHSSIVTARCRNFAEGRRQVATHSGHIPGDVPALVKAAAACDEHDRLSFHLAKRREGLYLPEGGAKNYFSSRRSSQSTTASDDSSSWSQGSNDSTGSFPC